MNKRKEYIVIAAVTLMSWGVFFPQYTFTKDSYRVIGMEDTYDEQEAVQAAIQDGRVRYKLKFWEYIKGLLAEDCVSGAGFYGDFYE